MRSDRRLSQLGMVMMLMPRDEGCHKRAVYHGRGRVGPDRSAGLPGSADHTFAQ
jgi:hypothetical protein